MNINFEPQNSQISSLYTVRSAEKAEKATPDTKPATQDQVTISNEGLSMLEADTTESCDIPEEQEGFIHKLADLLKPDEEESSAVSNDTEEGQETSGEISINAGKLARRLAAAKTKAQVEAIIAEIKQNLAECDAGAAQNMTVDEASVQATQNLLNQAKQRMGAVDNRDATPEEEMAFSMSDLM